MSHEIKIPSVGESISSATVGAWSKEDGDFVRSGEVIVSIDTDKISQDLESDRDGVLRRLAEEGDELDIGAPVARIEEGEAPDEGGESEEAEDRPEESDESGKKGKSEKAEKSDGKEKGESGRVKATPVARKIAEEEGIDLSSLQGSGAGGKIVKADVVDATEEEGGKDSGGEAAEREEGKDARAEEGGEAATERRAPADRDTGDGGDEGRGTPARTTRRRMSALRRKIATHLVNAQREAAILTTFNECDMSEVIAVRKRLQEDFTERHGVKLGFMSFFIKAVVEALKAVPSVNARIEGEEIVENHFYDIGVAVGTERGLVVPVLRECDRKPFAEIEKDLAGYARKAREGAVELGDLQGGVFTVTNGGIYGSLLSTPILNSPQSGILGMHSIQERPVAVDGEVAIRPMMYLALSYDHRLVDGKDAVTFLVRVKDCIEQPGRLLVGA